MRIVDECWYEAFGQWLGPMRSLVFGCFIGLSNEHGVMHPLATDALWHFHNPYGVFGQLVYSRRLVSQPRKSMGLNS